MNNITPLKFILTLSLLGLGGWGTTTIKTGGDQNASKITNFVVENFIKQEDSFEVDEVTKDEDEAFIKFCKGDIDLVNSSRAMNAHEQKLCSQKRTKYKEKIIGLNAIIVIVNNKNTVIHCLDSDKIRGIWGFDDRRHIASWQALYPDTKDQAIVPIAPDNEDLVFIEKNILSHDNSMGDYQEMQVRSNVKKFEDVNEMFNFLYNNKYAIAFTNYKEFMKVQEHFNPISIEDEYRRCVQPNLANISKNKYKSLSRPLYVYYNSKTFSSSTEKDFIDFYMHNYKQAAEMSGYIPYAGK